MSLLRPAILAVLCAALCFSAEPISPQKLAKVEELFRVTKTEVSLKRTLVVAANQMKASVLQQATGIEMGPEEQKRFDQFQSKVQGIVFGALSWDKVKPIYAKLYAEKFTDAELDSVIAFYKTPAGQAFIDASPQLMNEGMVELREQLKTVQPELQQLITQYRQQSKTPEPSKH